METALFLDGLSVLLVFLLVFFDLNTKKAEDFLGAEIPSISSPKKRNSEKEKGKTILTQTIFINMIAILLVHISIPISLNIICTSNYNGLNPILIAITISIMWMLKMCLQQLFKIVKKIIQLKNTEPSAVSKTNNV